MMTGGTPISGNHHMALPHNEPFHSRDDDGNDGDGDDDDID